VRCARQEPGLLARECATQSVSVDPKEIMLGAVNERDWNLLPVPVVELLVCRDVCFDKGFTELSGDLRNDDASVITQMTTGTSQQGDSGRRRGQQLLLVTTLNASLLEQLAMLLLSHALAPLLDD
jgi:hypothetical protein